LLACKRLGWKELPALVAPVADETEAAIVSLSENIHRRDLDYEDKMRAAIGLLEQLGTVARVAKRLGVSKQTVRNYLGYGGVPAQLKEMVKAGRMSAKTALDITSSVPDERRAVSIAEAVVEEPTRQRKRMIIDVARENPTRPTPEVVRRARALRYSRITIELTPTVAESLADACRDYNSKPEEIARQAVEQWLQEEGFLP